MFLGSRHHVWARKPKKFGKHVFGVLEWFYMLTENIVRGTTDPEIDSVTRIEHSTASPPCQLKGRVWRASTKVKSQLNSYESINWFPDQTDPDATTFAFTQFTDATQSCQIIFTRPKEKLQVWITTVTPNFDHQSIALHQLLSPMP